jgi:hypothetical protein
MVYAALIHTSISAYPKHHFWPLPIANQANGRHIAFATDSLRLVACQRVLNQNDMVVKMILHLSPSICHHGSMIAWCLLSFLRTTFHAHTRFSV